MVRKIKSRDWIQPPHKCDSGLIDAFRELVIQGEQVQFAGLNERLRAAHLLAFHYLNDELVAIAALKQPSESYRDKVFRCAQATMNPNSFRLELGWVFTREDFRGRGISRHLLELLLQKAGEDKLFATTRADNHAMQRLLKSLGFERAGSPFSGEGADYLIELWFRQSSYLDS
jgi:ribosomal protein S18 acetylase RimI-like enzyme